MRSMVEGAATKYVGATHLRWPAQSSPSLRRVRDRLRRKRPEGAP